MFVPLNESSITINEIWEGYLHVVVKVFFKGVTIFLLKKIHILG